MGKEIDDLQEMMQTLAKASTDPNGVSVGEFAKAVQSLQAELAMLEDEVNRLGQSVDTILNEPADIAIHEATVDPAGAAPRQAAASKP